MKKTLKYKVFAYLTPNPFDGEFGIEANHISWLPGFVNERTLDIDNPIYTEVNQKLFDKIENKVKREFLKGLKNMMPLCKEVYVKKVNIGINFLSIMGIRRAAACYLYGHSNPMKGFYHFEMGQNLMLRYMKKTSRKKSLESTIWEHELIHMLDHKEIIKSSIFAHSSSKANNLRYFILKFREEGIADLYYLLKGNHPNIHSLEEAKEIFREKVKWAGRKCKEAARSDEKFRHVLYGGDHFYDVGPWLILDFLQRMGADLFDNMIEDSLTSIYDGTVIPEEKILKIIQKALEFIECNDFLNYSKNLMSE